jgi:molybdenum cofactor cytidylyltransferase
MRDQVPERIAGVVLAAGASTRMGKNKLLLDLAGESVVRRATRAALDAGLRPVILVLGHEAERVRAALSGLDCVPVVNPAFAAGMDGSIRAGVAAVPPDAVAAVVTLADMPLVDASMLATLVARYRETRAPLVVSDYAGVRAPPVLYDRRLFPELLTLDGGGGKQVVARHRADAVAVSWPLRALADLDEPADHERVLRALRSEGGDG